MTGTQGKVADAECKPTIWLWILAVTLCANAVLLWFGLTEDAITVGKTLKKELLGITIRLVDERQTFSIISAISKLRSDGDYFLFVVIFLFSIVFPIVKLAGNALIWVSLLRNGRVVSDWLGRSAHWLHWLGKWSMLEVFVAGLLCVLLKLGQVARFRIEEGMYWFFAAVFLSLVNAHWTKKTLRVISSR
ncbi:MAG: paraquat-inducible protein A [Verrucomicrobiota bacterium]